MKRAILLVNWNDVFSSKTADEKVENLKNVLLNISRNFIPHNIQIRLQVSQLDKYQDYFIPEKKI